MNIKDKIFMNSPSAIQNFLLTIYAYKRRKKRFGEDFDFWKEKYSKGVTTSIEDIRDYQLELVLEKVKFAYENSPFYKRLYNNHGIDVYNMDSFDDFEKLPIISKEDLRNYNNKILTRSINNRDEVISTSGSTGKPLKIFRDTYNNLYENANIWVQREWADITPKDKFATFAGRTFVKDNKKPYWRYNRADNQLLVSSYHLNEANLNLIVRKLKDFRPVFIQGYPSNLFILADYIKKHKIKLPSVKAVFTSSETLQINQRYIIETALNCKVFDYYGSGEQASSALQCGHGRYHFNPIYSYTEIINKKIIGTNLFNDLFPLIRYDIGDEIGEQSNECNCGSMSMNTDRIIGRTSTNYVLTPDGRKIADFNQIIKNAINTKEIQIVQNSRNSLELNIVKRKDYTLKDELDLKKEFEMRLGKEININFNYTHEIPKDTNGKLQLVKSKL